MKKLFLTLVLSLFFGIMYAQPVPSTPTNIIAYGNDFGTSNKTAQTVMVIVNYDSTEFATSYTVTPYLILQGNGEKAITSLAKTFNAGSPQPYRWAISFLGPELRAAQEVANFFSTDRKDPKFKFKVVATNAAGSSAPGTSSGPAVTVK